MSGNTLSLGGQQAIQREDRSDGQHATAEFKTPEHPSIDTTESDILSVAMMLLIMEPTPA